MIIVFISFIAILLIIVIISLTIIVRLFFSTAQAKPSFETTRKSFAKINPLYHTSGGRVDRPNGSDIAGNDVA